MGRVLLGLLVGVLLILIGAALASDYRGIATKHIELSMQTVRSVSPFRWTDDRLARRRARFIAFDRLFGVLTMLAGATMLVGGAHLLLSEHQ
ncbi:conserved exported hypothetical protein [Micromonospora lupini str. Lupac 08]|uniref:Integral membrane protein n=1 Tax=Micromonospora lupini str. Lupac 08 TaxID=1150864 RepID=I0KW72_9ACTN|nr:conserved exported hypothetical protein [Micromonospora lupini str. Lupac 08]